MNNWNGIGRLTRDPELKFLPSGVAMCRFSIAIDRGMSKKKKDEAIQQGKQVADFINIVVWGKTAENCANYLKKGRLVAVQGRLQSGSYEAKDGSKRYTTDVVAQNVEFLEWGDKKENTGGNQDFHPVDNDSIPF